MKQLYQDYTSLLKQGKPGLNVYESTDLTSITQKYYKAMLEVDKLKFDSLSSINLIEQGLDKLFKENIMLCKEINKNFEAEELRTSKTSNINSFFTLEKLILSFTLTRSAKELSPKLHEEILEESSTRIDNCIFYMLNLAPEFFWLRFPILTFMKYRVQTIYPLKLNYPKIDSIITRYRLLYANFELQNRKEYTEDQSNGTVRLSKLDDIKYYEADGLGKPKFSNMVEKSRELEAKKYVKEKRKKLEFEATHKDLNTEAAFFVFEISPNSQNRLKKKLKSSEVKFPEINYQTKCYKNLVRDHRTLLKATGVGVDQSSALEVF